MRNVLLLLFCYCSLTFCTQAQDLRYKPKEMVNVAYLSPEETVVDSLQQLNLVLPEGAQNPPLFLWIGGGAWSFVNRHQEMDLARQFAQRGIAVASVGHQLSRGQFSSKAKVSGVKHPAHVQDVAAAFAWLYEHAAEYGYDAQNIFVGGFSSGAHLAALLAMDERYLQKHGLKQANIRAILPIAGAYDIGAYYEVFLNHKDPEVQAMAETHVKDVFGEEAGFTKASLSSYIDQLKIPMLLVSEGGLFAYTQTFEQQIWESEYRQCQILHVMNLGHGGLWKDLSQNNDSQARKVMVDFIRRNVGQKAE